MILFVRSNINLTDAVPCNSFDSFTIDFFDYSSKFYFISSYYSVFFDSIKRYLFILLN